MSNGDGLQQMLRLVNTFLNRPDTLAFREPVDPKAMNIPDYFQIVKKPMDLGTVSAFLVTDLYISRLFCVNNKKTHFRHRLCDYYIIPGT